MRVTRPASRPSSRCRPLSLARLDDRTVPAVVDYFNGVLTYTGGPGVANDLTIKFDFATQTYSFHDSAEAMSLNFTKGTGSGTHSVRVGPLAHSLLRIEL